VIDIDHFGAMKTLHRSGILILATIALCSCEAIKGFDYAVGTQGNGYFLSVAPKTKPSITSAKSPIDVRP
jgi:hypothetical protein